MTADPAVRRARLPDGYGLPEDSPTLSWESVESRFKDSLHYWISTADADGNPLSRPIDGVWVDGALYFSGHDRPARSPAARSPSRAMATSPITPPWAPGTSSATCRWRTTRSSASIP